MTEHQIRVALVDDQRLLREGLRIILEAAPDIQVIGEADDGNAAVSLAQAQQPDVMLMDIRMPSQDGISATALIKKTYPLIRIILLTTYDAPQLLVDGLKAGAVGFLLKDCSAEELCNAVRAVARGQSLLQTASAAELLAGMILQPQPTAQSQRVALGLTEREQEVLELIVRGWTNNEIAKGLGVSEATVKTHVNHIFAKCGARDRTHVVVLAHKLGLILP